MPKKINMIGIKFNQLTVIKEVEKIRGRIAYDCLCDCGKTLKVTGNAIKSGGTRSCGCLKKQNNGMRTHGMCKTRVYSIWCGIINRCCNKSDKVYYRYGGRGITVCDEWRSSFITFFNDMGIPPKGLTIERINNNQGYSKENCKWATYKEQARNTRHCRPLTYEGKTMLVLDWAKYLGINESSLRCRIGRLGWSIERALSTYKKH